MEHDVIEADVENHLVAEVRKAGGEVRKMRWIGRRNAPDRFVMHQNLPGGCCLIELKAPKKTPNPGQVAEHRLLRNHGVLVLVLDTIEKVDAFVSQALAPRGEWVFLHNKTGTAYAVLYPDAVDRTNARNGEPTVVYRGLTAPGPIYVRAKAEFHEKFTAVGARD